MTAKTRWGSAVAVAAGAALAGLWLLAPAASGQVVSIAKDEKPFVAQLLVGGGPQLGISVRDLESADREKLKLPSLAGAYVEDVREDSAAAKAGIRESDVITVFDGENVRSARQLTRLVRETPAGREVPVTVMRDGQRVDLKVMPEEGQNAFFKGRQIYPMPEHDFSFAMPEFEAPEFDLKVHPRMRPMLGVTTQELTPQLAEYFGAKDGVLVTAVSAGSAAEKAGLKAGDVITAVNGKSVERNGDLRRYLREVGDDGAVSLEILRDRKAMTLKATVERDRSIERRITRREIV